MTSKRWWSVHVAIAGMLAACAPQGAASTTTASSTAAAPASAPVEMGPLQKTCDGGKLPDCVELGLLYARDSGDTKNPAKAAALFQKACDGGEMRGCTELGLLYALGDGVTKD